MAETRALAERQVKPAALHLTPAESHWGKVLGVDSAGNAITTTSLVLHEETKGLTAYPMKDARSVHPGARMLVIGEGNAVDPRLLWAGETDRSMVEFEMRHRDVVDLTKIMRDPDYGPKLKQHLDEYEKLGEDLRAEDRIDSSFQAIRFSHNFYETSPNVFAYVGAPEVDKYDHCNFKLHYMGDNDEPVDISLRPKQSTVVPGTHPPVVLTLIVNENNGHYMLVPSRPKFSDALPKQEAQPVELTRLASQEDVSARLQRDFPWLQDADIFPPGKHLPIAQVGEGRVEIDEMRFKQIYDQVHDSELKGAKPNEFEELYIAARDYCHALQLACRVEYRGEDLTAMDGRLRGMKREEKEALMDAFVAKVEGEKQSLLAPRRQKEKELFGHQLPDLARLPKRRYVSGNTIYPNEYLGKYYLRSDTISWVTDLMHGESGGLFEEGKDAYRMLADVESHEEGHAIVPDGLGEKWPRSEVWNEWFSVIYPRRLQGQEPEFISIYQRKVNNGADQYSTAEQQHGAHELDKMVQELVGKAQTGRLKYKNKSLTAEDVERSVLASAFAQRERGDFEFMGAEVTGFADLYDAVTLQENHKAFSGFSLLPARTKKKEAGPFEKRLEGCEDVAYRARGKKKSESAGRNIGYQDVEKMLLQSLQKQIVGSCKELLDIK